MKICLFFILISGLVLGQNPTPKQDVEKDRRELGIQLLQQAQQAMGGAEKLAAVKDMTCKIETAYAANIKIKSIDRFVVPNYLREEQDSPVGKIIGYTNGKSGWMIEDQSRVQIPDEVLTVMKGRLFRQLPVLLLSDRDVSRTVKAVNDQAVEISTKGGLKVRIEFDPTTGLPARHHYTEPPSNNRPRKKIESFSDWREVGGIKLPYKVVHQEVGETVYEATVFEYIINSGMTAEQLSK